MKHLTIYNRNGLKGILVLIFMMACVGIGYADSSISLISAIKVFTGDNKSDLAKEMTKAGYTIVTDTDGNYADANKNGGGQFVYIGYKTTTKAKEAISDILVVEGSDYKGSENKSIEYNGRKYWAVAYNSDSNGGNLNRGRGSGTKNLYLYYTKERQYFTEPAVTSLKMHYRTSTPSDAEASRWVKLFTEKMDAINRGSAANINDGSETMVFLEMWTHDCRITNRFSYEVGDIYRHDKVCTVCEFSVSENHSASKDAVVECYDKDEHYWGDCELCHRPLYGKHEYAWLPSTSSPESGHEKRCLTCDYVDASESHRFTTTKAPKETTCTEAGWTEGKYCYTCNYSIKSVPIPASHTSDDDGWCTICHEPVPAPISDEDGWAMLSKPGHLYWYARVGWQYYNARMVCDITDNQQVIVDEDPFCADASRVSGFRKWTPIGNSEQKYDKQFDGQHHSISGIYCNMSSNYAGLFGFIGENGKVSGVQLVDSYIGGTQYVGSICGRNDGVISQCYSDASVCAEKSVAGGLVCVTNGQLNHCWFDGRVTADSGTGGLVSIFYAGIIDGCLSSGEVNSRSPENDHRPWQLVNRTYTSSCTVKNSFATSGKDLVNDQYSPTIENVGLVTAFQLESGEACWLLNGMLDEDGDYPVWRQDIGTDKWPGYEGPIVKYEPDLDWFFNYTGGPFRPTVANVINAVRKDLDKSVIDAISNAVLEKK